MLTVSPDLEPLLRYLLYRIINNLHLSVITPYGYCGRNKIKLVIIKNEK